MASCGLGASNIKLAKLDFGNARRRSLQKQNATSARMGWRQMQRRCATSLESKKTLGISCCSPVKTEATANEADISKETKTPELRSQLTPSSSEIQSLLEKVCDTTSIAEFELKLGGFHLYVARKIVEESKSSSSPGPASAMASPAPAPVSVSNTSDGPGSNGAVSTSLAIYKRSPYSGSIESFLDRAADDGLVILPSPRVGFFRRSRTIKGKRAPPSCKEKQIVKEGQVLCYIEQLGGELPIESDVSGEVIRILREEGEPVGYGDALIAILPSFPGIK